MNIHEYEYENSNEYSRHNKVSVASTVYSLDILYHKYYIFSRVLVYCKPSYCCCLTMPQVNSIHSASKYLSSPIHLDGSTKYTQANRTHTCVHTYVQTSIRTQTRRERGPKL